MIKSIMKERIYAVSECAAAVVIFQAALLSLRSAVGSFTADTDFSRRMLTMAIMLLLSAAVIFYAKIRRVPLSVFPKHFGKIYIIVTVIAAALLISSPSNFTGGIKPIMLAAYGSVVTPIYEELLFRGFMWNRLKRAFRSEVGVYVITVALFTLWHLFYMLDSIAAGNFIAVLWKLAAGLGYGAVLGAIRIKTQNCYSTMLAHGLLNMFMI